jgi:hypothetical protein
MAGIHSSGCNCLLAATTAVLASVLTLAKVKSLGTQDEACSPLVRLAPGPIYRPLFVPYQQFMHSTWQLSRLL